VTGYAGTISQVSASENSKVSKNTRLFTLKDTDYSANYNSLLRQRAELEETLLELLTIQRDGALLAQMDGSVYSEDYNEDAVIENVATPVVTLSNDKKMSVTINVDESDILSLELGQAVSVTVKSVSEDAFTGTLTEVNRTSSSSGVYSAEIEVDKVAGMLSGMTADVDVRIQGVDDTLLVPVDAVHKTRDGAYVYTTYDTQLQEYGGRVDVITGLENSNFAEIKSGLKAGDTVYYTEARKNFFGFGNMGGYNGGGNGSNMGGNRPSGGSSNRPSGGSGNRPSGYGG
jgi:multidrug efflux pump subunit AcrA (membrane-fusion protein)